VSFVPASVKEPPKFRGVFTGIGSDVGQVNDPAVMTGATLLTSTVAVSESLAPLVSVTVRVAVNVPAPESSVQVRLGVADVESSKEHEPPESMPLVSIAHE
jgi:hypothetical protein